MVGMKRMAYAGAAASILVLMSCPSPFLARIQQKISEYPFTAVNYSFVRQWGNALPQYAFSSPLIKADTAGFVYVADSTARIRKYNGAGVIQNTFAIVSLMGFQVRVYDMAFDALGNMYVVTNNPSQIQKYDVSGNLLLAWGGATVYGSGVLGDPSSIAVDSTGSVYVADATNRRIVKFDSSGNFSLEWGGASTTYGSNTPSAALSDNLDGMAVDRNNRIYVTDEWNDRVVVFDSNGGFLNDWGGLTEYAGHALSEPKGITLSSGATQFVCLADSANERVVMFSTDGTYQTDWGTPGTADNQFTDLAGVAVDTSGYVYATDESADFAGRVQKFDVSAAPTWLATWGAPPGAADGVLYAPWGVVTDSSGNIYVAEIANNRVQKFDPSGSFLAKWGGTGAGPGQLSMPAGIAIDGSGNILVADMGNNRVQVFDASGAFIKQISSSGSDPGYLSGPLDVAVDGSGNIYVAELMNQRVSVFDGNGYFVRIIGSPGTADGQFEMIYALAVDSSANVYVTDISQYRVQKFDSQGTFLMKWGSQGSDNGQFQNPVGISVDGLGNIYVCDMLNHRIQKFDRSGGFLGRIGGVGVGSGTFSWPVDVTLNSAGNVFVTDYTGFLVQEFAPAE